MMIERKLDKAAPFPSTHSLGLGDSSPPKSGSPEDLLLRAPEFAKRRTKAKVSLGIEDPTDDERAKTFPNLLNDRRIKVDPFTGHILLSSWRRTTREKVDKNQQTLFRDVESNERVALRRWSEYPDIESTIRSASYIIKEYSPGGETSENLNTVLALCDDLFEGITSGEITIDNMDDQIDYAIHVLGDSGLLKPKVPNKVDLKKQILDALGKDSIGRGNILISRTRLAAATIRVLEERLIARQTLEKYNYLLVSQLYVERLTERLFIEKTLEQVERFLNLPQDYSDLPQAEVNLETFAKTFLDPERIKASPYRGPALMFLVYVFGWPKVNTKEWKKMLRTMYSDEKSDVVPMIDKVHEDRKDGSINTGNSFRERVSHGLAILEEVLRLGERDLESV